MFKFVWVDGLEFGVWSLVKPRPWPSPRSMPRSCPMQAVSPLAVHVGISLPYFHSDFVQDTSIHISRTIYSLNIHFELLPIPRAQIPHTCDTFIDDNVCVYIYIQHCISMWLVCLWLHIIRMWVDWIVIYNVITIVYTYIVVHESISGHEIRLS